jgi:hypothetical protein
MKNFDEIKKLWSENETDLNVSPQFLLHSKKDQIHFFKKQYGLGAIGSTGVALFFVWFTFFSNRSFNFELSSTALSIMAGCSLVIAMINLYNLFLISKIDETLAPKEYLSRWVAFYSTRFQFFRLYAPVLFLAFCLSFVLYLPEILGYYPNTTYKTGFIVFIILIFIGIKLFGRRSILEEKMKLNNLNHTIRTLAED